MNTNNKIQVQTSDPEDWLSFYSDLQRRGNVPEAAITAISENNAVFRDMFLDLSVIKEQIRQSGITPVITTIYADVLKVPSQTNWLLQSSGLVIYARRIEAGDNTSIIINYQQSASAQVVVFADEFSGSLSVLASKSSQEPPVVFTITEENVSPGISIGISNGLPVSRSLQRNQGIGFQVSDDMQMYLNNAFIFGSLLYDQNPVLALSIFLWVKGWASQNILFEELFYRSASLVALLSTQINAANNGAVFVPYLTSNVYTTLANAFAADAAKYESDYMHLSTQKVLTDENIVTAKTMAANAQSEIDYVNALLKQANANYDKAVAAATIAQRNFNTQQIAVIEVSADFQKIGIPEYEREQIIKAIVDLAKCVITFGTAIAAMAMGDGAAAPAAAKGAVDGVKAVANIAEKSSEVAKTASSLAETMEKLKKLIEALKKVFELAKAVKEVADHLSTASGQMQVIQKLQDTTDGANLSAADGWAIYKLQADDILKDPIDKGIKFASEYKQALDILVIYGQSLSASQLAVIQTSQQVASIVFQLQYAQQKQANLQNMINSLQAGEAPILAMMQQFYQKYLDNKSSLFAALKSYQASYFYWALRKSSVRPQIVDPVSSLNSGIQDITKITMDSVTALNQFDPPPQIMENMHFVITDSSVLQKLISSGQTTWVLPMDDPEFAGLARVRLNKIRVWLEGVSFKKGSGSVYITIATDGNNLDTYNRVNYQFNSKPLNRSFKYEVAKQGNNNDWEFDDGMLGFVQIDGAVDKEVAYAYFQPTPFSAWTISLPPNNNPGLDYSKISKITMYFEGTAIGSTDAAKKTLTMKRVRK